MLNICEQLLENNLSIRQPARSVFQQRVMVQIRVGMNYDGSKK
jgi:hypothetical protein